MRDSPAAGWARAEVRVGGGGKSPSMARKSPQLLLGRRGAFATPGELRPAAPRSPCSSQRHNPLRLLLTPGSQPVSTRLPAPRGSPAPRPGAASRPSAALPAPLRASPLRKRWRGGTRCLKGGRLLLRRGRRKSEAPPAASAISAVYMHLAGLPLAPEDGEKGRRCEKSPSPAMCSVSEAGSTDPLVARFRQVEETLEKLHRENRSLKSKVPRYNALCTLYHESAQQLKHLQLQLAAKEATVWELRGSLARQQQQQQQQAAAGEVGAEPARSLVESLLEQLGQAQERLRNSERLSALRVEALSQEVQKLNQQLEEKNTEIEQMINQPPYEKEREILRLQKSLAEREKAQATSDVLCRSLTDETHQLQRKLASTAEMCQHLAKCLEEKQRKEKGNSDDQIATERSNQLQVLDNETSLQALICKLQEENRMLKQKVAHVEDLNAKWQKYDASRDEYVKRLHLQLKELKLQLEQQHGVASAQTNSELMQKEILRLNKLLEEKMNECKKSRRELEDEKKAREGDNERIQMLEQQVLVYKDDFTSERSDRERAQSKIQELQLEVSCLQQQLARRQEGKKDSRDTSSRFRVHTGNQNHMHVQTKVEHLRGSSPGQPGGRRTASQSEQTSPPADNGNSGSEGRTQGELRCPHCMRFFSDELSDEFLKHVTECCQ